MTDTVDNSYWNTTASLAAKDLYRYLPHLSYKKEGNWMLIVVVCFKMNSALYVARMAKEPHRLLLNPHTCINSNKNSNVSYDVSLIYNTNLSQATEIYLIESIQPQQHII